MRRSVVLVPVVLIACLAAGAGIARRGALYAVVRSCVLAKAHVGTPFPCLDVQPPSDRTPGIAVLRVPGSPTHVIVTPTDRIAGIESPALQVGTGGAYWQAALAARRHVSEGAGASVAMGSIGLAINSDRTRSQDQLHIHAECIRPGILAAIRAQTNGLGSAWRELPRPIDRDRFFARRVMRADLARDNLFAALADLPGTGGDLSGMVAVMIEADARTSDDAFVLLASPSRRDTVESLFDDGCRAALTGRTGAAAPTRST